jgi:hypothetical protein
MSSPTEWRSTHELRTGLICLFGADAAVSIALGASHLHRSDVVGRYARGSATYAEVNDADDLLGTIALVGLLLLLATATVFIIWQWRSAKNNEALGRIRPRYSPGWSIGGWFVPLANLVIPVRIMQDLWQGSDPEHRNFRDWHGLRRWSVIGWWWAFYLAGNVLWYFAGSHSDGQTLADIEQTENVRSVGSVLSAVAACLAIFVVHRITQRQEQARDARRAIGSDTTAAPAWYADPTGRFEYRYWNGSAWSEYVARGGQMSTDPIA